MFETEIRGEPDQHAGFWPQRLVQSFEVQLPTFKIITEINQQADIPVNGFAPAHLSRYQVTIISVVFIESAGGVFK